MASTSPYTQNDYQAVSSYRPYKLPVNDIFKAYVAQNQFWEAGAQRVKSAYEGALNLSLVTDDNKSVRDNYMKESEKQLTKLSSMDLSDVSIQRQGMDLFKPLMRDENIIGEDYVVRNLNKELATGQDFRTKNGGKEYNPLSIENLQFEKSLLSGPLNKRDGWKSLYSNMSTYTPQYDTTGELKKITDLVKEQEVQNANINGDEWYIETINKKGVSKEKIQAAIQELGSPQLKEAMRVEGRNAFYKNVTSHLNNPGRVDEYFQGLASQIYDQKINDLKDNKAEVDYQEYITGDKTKKSKYRNLSGEIDRQITHLEVNEKPKFVADFTNLGNLDNLATNVSKVEQLWQSASINRLAPTLAWESQTREVEANPVKIAKENNKLAVERINLGYQNLAEDKRHNLETEADDRVGRELEAARIAADKGNKKDPNSPDYDPLTGGGVGPMPTSTAGVVNQNDLAKAQEEARNQIVNQDYAEPLREAAVVNLIGANAWAGIQQAVPNNGKLGETLTDTEIENTARLFKAFNDKYGGQSIPGYGKGVGNTFMNKGVSLDDYKKEIPNWDVAKFKRMVGNMVKHDNELIGDLAAKIYQKDGKVTEEGKSNAARFRGAINTSLTRDMNVSNSINKKLPTALGSYSKYFDNNGATLLTDQNIDKAYQNYLKDNQKPIDIVTIERNTKSDNFGAIKSSRKATPQEVEAYHNGTLKLPGAEKISAGILSRDSFVKNIRKATDPVFYTTAAEFNTNMMTVGLEKNKNREAIVQGIRNITAASGTDANPNIPAVLDFIEKRADKVSSYNIYTPGAGKTLPQIKVNMSGLSKDDQATWDAISNTVIPVTTADKRWYQKGPKSIDYRFTGAVLATVPVNNPEKGEIRITNSSRSADRIDPELKIDNLYYYDTKGQRKDISEDDMKTYLEQYFRKPLGTVLEDNMDQVHEVLAYYVNSVEQRNREYKENKK